MRLVMTADRLYSRDVPEDDRYALIDWVRDELGYLETEVNQIAVTGEGVVELTHLVPGDQSYQLDDAGHLLWVTDTITVHTTPPGLSYFEHVEAVPGG